MWNVKENINIRKLKLKNVFHVRVHKKKFDLIKAYSRDSEITIA